MHRLKAYLDRPSRASDQLSYHALQGFLFGIVVGPASVATRDWTMRLLPGMDDETHDEFCDLYSEIERGVVSGTPALPADCPLAPEPLSNLHPASPVSQWSQGLWEAQLMLGKDWAILMANALSSGIPDGRAFADAVLDLHFFGSREKADAAVRESAPPRTLAELAADLHGRFETNMAMVATFARQWRESAGHVGPERPVKSPATTGIPKTHLKAFLARASSPSGALSYHALQGFIFGVASAPKGVPAPKWLSKALGDALPALKGDDEMDVIIAEMDALYREIEARLARGVAALPPDCPMATDPMANLDPASPVSQWSHGFSSAHTWLGADWVSVLEVLGKKDVAMAKELGGAFWRLLFFSSPSLANAVVKTAKTDTLEELAAEAREKFQSSMFCYAEVGRAFRELAPRASKPDAPWAPSVATRAPIPRLPVGRNQPCTCGSGKKYKKCCGAVH